MAFRQLSLVRKNANQHEHTYLETLATAKADADSDKNTTASQHLSRLLRERRQRRESRMIRYAMGTFQGKRGLSMVIAPDNADGSGPWTEHSSKEALERACLQENDRRFHQARATPFVQEPLRPLVGRFAETQAAAKIL